MAIRTTQEAFLHELGDVYDAEHRFLQGQQKMLQHASSPKLQNMIQTHIEQTKGHISNLEKVFSTLGAPSKAEKCDAAMGLVAEAQSNIQDAEEDTVRDVLIGGSALRVEHYEIAAYNVLIPAAQMMGQQQVVSLLQQNLSQEEQTAQLIEQSAPELLRNAMQGEGMQPKDGAMSTPGSKDSVASTGKPIASATNTAQTGSTSYTAGNPKA